MSWWGCPRPAPGGGSSGAPSSKEVAERVRQARERMVRRNPAGQPNSALTGEALRRHLALSTPALERWRGAIRQRRLSARSAERLVRVARTIADLEGSTDVLSSHLAEALTYRSFDQLQSDADQLLNGAIQPIRGPTC